VKGLSNVDVKMGRAQRLPVRSASVDVVHARTAYFFGPGCEPGLAEAERVLRPGGVLLIVDLDVTSEPYGTWMRADLPHYDPGAVERFFARAGFGCRRVTTEWRFETARDLEAVLKIEFSKRVAEQAIAESVQRNGNRAHDLTLPVGYRVHARVKPTGLVVPGHSAASSDVEDSSSSSPRMP
jgi:ubiquinone/menaquinone biosynthesis C-methylase UbiE